MPDISYTSPYPSGWVNNTATPFSAAVGRTFDAGIAAATAQANAALAAARSAVIAAGGTPPQLSAISYTSPYPGGWVNNTTTPWSARVGRVFDAGISRATAQANAALSAALSLTPAPSSGYYAPPDLTGLSVVDYASLPGATTTNFADTLAAVTSNKVIRLTPDTDYYINHDFSMPLDDAAGGYACLAQHVMGIICDGTTDPTKRARIHMGAGQMSTTALAKIPLQSSNQVNSLWALRCGPNASNAPVYFHGIEFIGHDQRTDPNTGLPAAYNGLQLYTPNTTTTLTWCKFRGFSQATYNAPPGETNTLSTYQGTGMNLYQVEADGVNGDGRRSGGAFSANGCTGIFWQDVYVHDTAVSGVTFSTAATNCGSLHTVRLKVRNNANHSTASGMDFFCVNHEGVNGPIVHESPDLLSPLDYNAPYATPHFFFGNQTANATVQITDPQWGGVSEPGAYGCLTIQVPTSYAGSANRQTSLPTVTLGGVTMAPVNKTAATSGINHATQYILKTA